MLAKRRRRKQRFQKSPRIFLKFRTLRRRIPVPHHQQVHLVRGIAHLLQFEQRPRRRRTRAVHKLVPRIDAHLPNYVEFIAGTLFQRHLDRHLRTRKPQRLGERPVAVERLVSVLPLTENGIESPRVQQLPAAPLPNLEEIIAHPAFVDGLIQVSRPFQRLQHQTIHAEPFFVRISGVIIIDAQTARSGKTTQWRKKRKEKRSNNDRERSFHERNCTSNLIYVPGLISTALSFSKLMTSGLPPFA